MGPKTRTSLLYAGLLGASIGAFFAIQHFGRSLMAPGAPGRSAPAGPALPESDELLVHALIALVVIILVARILGELFRLVKQPAVIGEMFAGILLGPSLLGRVAPVVSAHLFPALGLPFLSVVSQIGVVLFMFLVGVQLDTGLLRNRTRAALAISQASIVTPFLTGAALAPWLYPSYSSGGVSFAEFSLFIGVSMSVTAFPVLARILTDRRMDESRIGSIALACAAVGDVTAWCLLAFVVGVARAQPGRVFLTVGLTAAFIVLMLTLVRPAAVRFARREPASPNSSRGKLAIVCAALLLSALATQRIGIHALFGAFLLGVVVPHDSRLAHEIRTRLEDAVVTFLLPVFFVYTGLRTEISLVHSLRDWIVCGAIILAASAGKFGGSYTAARLTGLGGREAASLGILMNTRGLMELIVLNVGLDLGVLSPTLFAMFVLMALVTTFATTPILQALEMPRSRDA
jgi:Kef-type K+ transport system membrane component KefB